MAENSKIEWTDHTFNPWIGCTKVSAACDHCYAEVATPTRTLRASGAETWGPHAPRRRTSPANWKKPLAWNRQAQAEGRRYRVFCASLADVGDNHASILAEWRADLWHLIAATPNLDWLLLTKRPQNIIKMLPHIWGDGWPNVWIGTTVENQTEADRRIPHLLAVPAAVRFLSMEPLLGPVDLTRVGNVAAVASAFPTLAEEIQRHMRPSIVNGIQIEAVGPRWQATTFYQTPDHMGGFQVGTRTYPRLDWVICGGESGPGARPMHPDWARSLRDQCKAAGVAFHFKQWGEWAPGDCFGMIYDQPVIRRDGRVTDWMDRYVMTEEWGKRVRGHTFTGHATDLVYCVGKKDAGRKLDGRTWDEMPEVPHA